MTDLQKGFDTLLRAHAQLHDDIRLVILGEGPLRPRLERLARDLGIDHRVDFAGFLTNPYPCYRASDAVVLSSRWEGLPTVLIEALSLGTPVVSTDCPSGPAEILEDGRWGRLVPPDHPVALARAISATLEEGRPAPDASAHERFDVDRAVQGYLDVIGAALGHPRRQPVRPLLEA
jgi:glycosyltransferase involved in cell wall biosynthesis